MACLKALVSAFLYEPGNSSTTPPTEEYLYMHAAPIQLPKYCLEFCHPTLQESVVIEGPLMTTCVGTKEGTAHLFLSETGCFGCQRCSALLCPHCKISSDWDSAAEPVDKKRKVSSSRQGTSATESFLCCDCFVARAIAGGAESLLDSQAIKEKRDELRAANVVDAKYNGRAAEIEEMHDAYVVRKHTTQSLEPQLQTVPFPVLKSNEFERFTSKVLNFDFQNGGSFLRDERLTDEDRLYTLELFAKFVEYGDTKSEGASAKAPVEKVYTALPTIIIEFAKKSRVSSSHTGGYRLLERGCRHALDERSASLLDASGEILRYDGSICLDVSTQIRASFQHLLHEIAQAMNELSMFAKEQVTLVGDWRRTRVQPIWQMPLSHGASKSILCIDPFSSYVNILCMYVNSLQTFFYGKIVSVFRKTRLPALNRTIISV